jgi:hypothetical protein
MAVNIDTIYQRVLALANKEQRGYITPQEFNLFANQAQMDIFEQYFYDIKQFNRASGNDTEFSDPLHVLNEKMSIFEVERDNIWTESILGTNMVLPEEVYRLGTVRVGQNQVEMLTSKEFDAVRISPLTSPSLSRPIAYTAGNKLNIAIGSDTYVNAVSANINMSYIRKPNKVSWGYIVVNDKAMYDPTNTVNFELHNSEQGELTGRILAFAGITIKQGDLVQMASMMEQSRVMNEKQ